MKRIAEFALKGAKKSNSICPWVLYQPKVPKKVKQLKK